jgi:hypothetical protein
MNKTGSWTLNIAEEETVLQFDYAWAGRPGKVL